MSEINKLYKDLCKSLLDNGNEIAGTKEINGMMFRLNNIEDNYVTLSSAKVNVPYLIAELAWYFGGINRVNFIGKFADMWNRISDDRVTNNSAYGYILKYKFGFDQVEKVIELLHKDSTSRRAVLNINTPNERVVETKDEPCTIALQFLVRNKKLDCIGMMRSNDIFYGLRNDIVYFTELQKYIAYRLGLSCGTYTHFAGSFHVYEKDYDTLSTVIEDENEEDIRLNLSKIWKDEGVLNQLIYFIDNKFINKNVSLEEFKELCKNLGIILY